MIALSWTLQVAAGASIIVYVIMDMAWMMRSSRVGYGCVH